MFCRNCGSNVDGMKFCKNCGIKVEGVNTEMEITAATASEAKSAKEADKDLNTIGYVFVFLPLLGVVVTWIFASISSLITIGLNVGLWYADKAILKKYGYTGKWTWWAIFFPTVYLYFRCKNVDGNFKKLKQHIVMLLMALILALITL